FSRFCRTAVRHTAHVAASHAHRQQTGGRGPRTRSPGSFPRWSAFLRPAHQGISRIRLPSLRRPSSKHESENTSARPLRLPTIFASRTLRRDRGFKELCSHGTVDDRSIDDPDRNLPLPLTRTEIVLSATSPVVRASISLAIETFTPSLRPDQSVAAGVRGPHIPNVAVAIVELRLIVAFPMVVVDN